MGFPESWSRWNRKDNCELGIELGSFISALISQYQRMQKGQLEAPYYPSVPSKRPSYLP